MQFPVPEIDQQSENELNKQADQLLILNDKLKKASLQSQKDQLTSHIQHCETRIDELVYGLFNLTDEEIRIVEAN